MQESNTMQRMNKAVVRYVRTLWYSILGRNPHRAELAKLEVQYQAAEENVRRLKELYNKVAMQTNELQMLLHDMGHIHQ